MLPYLIQPTIEEKWGGRVAREGFRFDVESLEFFNGKARFISLFPLDESLKKKPGQFETGQAFAVVFRQAIINKKTAP